MNNMIITIYHCKFNYKEHKNTSICFSSSRLSLTVRLHHFWRPVLWLYITLL